jgi:hypothetical protein
MPKRPSPPQPTRSDIYSARHTPARWLGSVEAVDAAIEAAAIEFKIDKADRSGGAAAAPGGPLISRLACRLRQQHLSNRTILAEV